VDFTLSDNQALLQETARSLLAEACPVSLVRDHIEDPHAADPLWQRLREWTVLGGEALVDHCLFLEETGAVLAPGPYFATSALFAPLLGAIDHGLLPSVLAGETSGTVAVAGPEGEWIPNAEPVKRFVPEAERVDYVAVVSAGSRPEVTVYERPPAQHLDTLDFSRRLSDVDVRDATAVGPPVAIDPERFEAVMERAYVALAAEMMGTTRWLFDTTLAYAKDRHQFDRPIGSFQAVKHKLANMAVAREKAWSAVYYAAMTIDAGDRERHHAAHAAKVMAGEAAKLNAKDGIQIHGGIGYTYEHDLHLYIRRAYGSEHLLGTSDWHRDRLAALILEPAGA
jgi:alkylation response protein AidB-like acyl-CoA dehydrogenase